MIQSSTLCMAYQTILHENIVFRQLTFDEIALLKI